MDSKTREKLIQLYKDGEPLNEIISTLHIGKHTYYKVIEDALEKGEIYIRSRAIRSDRGKSKPRKDIYKEKVELARQVQFAQICDLYRKGYTMEEIVREVHRDFKTVKNIINKAQENNDLFLKNDPRRLEAVRKRREATGRCTEKKPDHNGKVNFEKIVPSTLKEGETIKCTLSVARNCVYGCSPTTENSGYCRFSQITNKCRSLDGYVGKEFFKGCSSKKCIRYSKVSKDNPKLSAEGETLSLT